MADRRLSVRIQLKGDENVSAQIKRLAREGQADLGRLESSAGRVSGSFQKISGAAGLLRGALGGVAAALSAREIIRMSDSYALLSGRLRLVTKSAEELAAVEKNLFQLAQQNRTSLESTVVLYSRMAQAAGELGLNTRQMLQLTDTIQKGLRLSGATAAEAAGSIIQFTQAVARGQLRGQEFISVMSGAPRVIEGLKKGLAEVMGVSDITTGDLIKMAEQGKLTMDLISQALLRQTGAMTDEYSKLPLTVGEAMTQMENSLTRFVGKNGAAEAAVRGLADGISYLAKQINHVNELADRYRNFTHLDVLEDMRDKSQRYLDYAVRGGPRIFESDESYKSRVEKYRGEVEYLTRRIKERQHQGIRGSEAYGPDPLPKPLGSPGPGGAVAAKRALDDYLQSVREDNRLMVLGNRERFIEEKLLRAQNAARQDGKKLTSEQRKEVEKLASAQYDHAEAMKAAEKRAKELEEAHRAAWRPVEQAFENIQDNFADMLVEGRFTADGLVGIFRRAAAEIAAAMVFRPIVGSVAGSLGLGGGGLFGGGGGSAGSGSGGGFFNGLSSVGSGLLGGFNTPLFSPTTTAFDIAGLLGVKNLDSIFGIARGLEGLTPLSGIAGFGGNLLANALFGQRGIGATIGGTVGGFGGAFAGGALLQGALGSFAGPAGALAGSFLGNALGGLVGGGKPHPGASFEGRLTPTGGLDVFSLLSKHMGTEGPQAAAQQLAGFLSVFGQAGAKFRPASIQGVFDPQGAAFRIRGENANFAFNPADASSTAEAMRQLTLYLAQTSGVVDNVLLDALKNVQTAGKDAAGVLASVAARLDLIAGVTAIRDNLQGAAGLLSPEAARAEGFKRLDELLAQRFSRQLSSGEVDQAVQAALGASRGYFGGSGPGYVSDVSAVEARLNQVLGNLPSFASGGDFGPGMKVFHPGELVFTKGSGHVFNADETKRLVSGGGEIAQGLDRLAGLLEGVIRQVGAQTMQLGGQLASLREENAALKRQLARVSAA